MKRSESLLDMLQSAALMQEHVAIILEAKAYEAEQRRSWVCNYMRDHSFPGCDHYYENSHDLHENIIDVIAGITRMEHSLAKNLSLLIQEEPTESAGSLADLFSGAGDTGDDDT